MSTIRRQSIISSLVVYLGFALGLLNTYLFTRQGGFTKAEFGLTNTFIAFAAVIFSVAGVAMPSYVAKFFPYYQARLEPKRNDMLAWALLIPVAGFAVVCILGLLFRDILVARVFDNSPQILQYYHWIFPFALGYTLFMVLEAYAWQQRLAVFSNLLKEVIFRLGVTVLIVLTTLDLIRDFNTFIGVYSFLYLVLVGFLIIRLYRAGQFHLSFSVTRVTRRFYKKIRALVTFIWGGTLILNLVSVFDGIVVAAVLPDGMAKAGVLYFAQNVSSLMQAPQRAIVSAAMGPLSQAWKEKDLGKISRIYQRSSINQLIFSLAMFCLIWLNFEDGIRTFRIQEDFLEAKWVFFYFGLYRILDMGTGLNAQIIGTSSYWRFEFLSGLVLLTLSLVLNWMLTRHLGLIGPGISNLVSFTAYNFIRCLFLWNKFRMQPFTIRSLYAVLLAGGCFLVSYLLFHQLHGFWWMVLRSVVFCVLFTTGMVALKLTPDLAPVLSAVRGRLARKR